MLRPGLVPQLMPYFFILPLYLLVVVLLAFVSLILAFVPRCRYLAGYGLAGTIGTFPGFVVANVIFLAFVMIALSFFDLVVPDAMIDPEFGGGVVGVSLLVLMVLAFLAGMIALLLVNGIGIAGGFVAGMLLFYVVRRSFRERGV